jgi:hypothetical protein
MAIMDSPTDWAPEAVFGTLRSLITLRRITTDDASRVMRSSNDPRLLRS